MGLEVLHRKGIRKGGEGMKGIGPRQRGGGGGGMGEGGAGGTRAPRVQKV